MTNNKIKFALAAVAALFYCISGAFATPQDEEKKKDPASLASAEAERMAKQFDLDDGQLYYVDSVLCHDYVEMCAELEKLSKAKVENYELFYSVQDKWFEKMEVAMKQIMTPEQWEKFMKQGGEKRAKERAKRREKAEKAANSEKINKKKK